MSNSSSQDDFATAGQPSPAFVQQVRGLQIITAALAIGASVMVGMIMLVTKDNAGGQPSVLAFVGIAMAVAQLGAHAVIPKIIASQQLRKLNREDLQVLSEEERQLKVVNVMRGPHIVGSALLEGAAVLNAIVYLVDHWIGSLAIAGALVVLLLLRTPSVFGMYNKVADALQEIEVS